jgi:hypothetical protein
MPKVISTEPAAWIIRIPRPTTAFRHLIRGSLTTWWNAWCSIAPDLGRGGLR